MSPDPPALDAATLASIHDRLIAWFAEHGRDLPWRRTRDPYRVLVSEVMLQQIQVARAIPFYKRFVARFPTVHTLAEAPIAEVIHAWGDLGRYRRIAFLHRAARAIVEEHGGAVPADVEALRALPGVGLYTAGAVACFAYERDVGFVDTNVRRVLGRLFGGAETALTERDARTLAGAIVPPGRGWAWNQALLDLGATVCTARAPRCDRCPLRELCAAYPGVLERPPETRSPGKTERFEETNRYFRGRVLAELRGRHADDDATDEIALTELGGRVKPAFANDDLPWLYDLVDGLRRDGLAHVAEERPAYDAGDAGELATVRVRLP